MNAELLLVDLSSIAHPIFSPDFIARFAKRIEQTASGCWLWTGATDRKGYGAVCYRRNMLKTHRVMWHLVKGSAAGVLVCHHCDVPACVNPSHLFSGTPADNSADMVRKGRHRTAPTRGRANGGAKATEALVLDVRRLSSAGVAQREIARRVGMSASQVGNIVHGRHWGWM